MRFVDTKYIPEDKAIAAKVKGYEKYLSKELDIEIGKTLSQLDSRKKTSSYGGGCYWEPNHRCYA